VHGSALLLGRFGARIVSHFIIAIALTNPLRWNGLFGDSSP